MSIVCSYLHGMDNVEIYSHNMFNNIFMPMMLRRHYLLKNKIVSSYLFMTMIRCLNRYIG